MSHAVNIPKLGLTMEEATLVEWHAGDGQKVAKGSTLLTIETDKIMFDVEAEADGWLQRVAPLNARLKVGDLAGYLHEAQGQVVADATTGVPAAPAGSLVPSPAAAPSATSAAATPAAPHPASLQGATGGRLLASPVARRLAEERGIALAQLQGSGPGGVILKRDVPAQPAAAPGPAPMAASVGSASAPAPAPAPAQRRPLTAMRRAISQRMMHSLSSSAQMTGFGRIDMAAATAWRATLLAHEAQLGVRITFTDLVLKACACALRDIPEVNAYIEGDDVVQLGEVNLGLAVSVEGGLLVPVIHRADQLSLVDICRARQAVVDKARTGRLTREDLEGGSFTLSNFGSYGGDFETPILNSPQSALLGIGRITDEPVVRDGQIVIRPIMMMSLTFDHRLIDGALAGRFRGRVRELLEQPALMAALLR